MLRHLGPTVSAAVLFAAIAAIASAKSVFPPPTGVSVTRADICLSDAECPPNKYCKRNPTTKLETCVQRLPNGAVCEQTADCQQNSFCFVDVVKRCRPQAKLNDECSPVQANVCRTGLTCTPPSLNSCVPAPACSGNVGRCLPSNPGRLGAPCRFDRDCAQDAGFFCKGEKACARKKPAGSDCNNASDNNECDGFCVSGFFALTGRSRMTNGVCAAAVPLGGPCTEDLQCASTFLPRSDRDTVLCNRPRGSGPGRCALASKLLRRLGAPCTRWNDACDARRGLSCRWAAHLKRTVCQQRFDRVDRFEVRALCTRGSKLSACPGPGQFFPTECRATRILPGTPFPTDFTDNYARCQRRRRVIPRGTSCDVESDVCASGSVCRVVPAVRLQDPGFRPRFGPQPAVFCVRELALGASCGTATKFTAQCGDGLRCANGKCVRVSGNAAREENTHANVGASCSDLPCAPGFTCGANKLCERPENNAGFGALCDDGGVVAPRCKRGLVCRTKWGPVGLNRCRWPQGVGAFCESQSWCKAGLECETNSAPGAPAGDRRCRQRLTTPIWRGQRCDPSARLSARRCATVQVKDVFDSATLPLTCLRPAGGAPKCQIAANEYGLCGASNVQCANPRFTCQKNVCVPRK